MELEFNSSRWSKILLHLKFGFRSLEDALDFYEKAGCSHVAQAAYYGDGIYETIFYANKPEQYRGDPDTGMKEYELARRYPSFIDGSVEAPEEEFSYMAGWRVVRKRIINR